jgi:hypothetical protein
MFCRALPSVIVTNRTDERTNNRVSAVPAAVLRASAAARQEQRRLDARPLLALDRLPGPLCDLLLLLLLLLLFVFVCHRRRLHCSACSP